MRKRTALVLVMLIAALGGAVAQKEGSARKEGSAAKEGSNKVAVNETAVALNGLDPVALTGGKEEKGKASIQVLHGNYRYHFANDHNRRTFQSGPEDYAVVDEDPVARVRVKRKLKGEPDIFAVYDGNIYLFASRESRDVFLKAPTDFVGGAMREGSGAREGSGKGEGSARPQ